MSLLIRFTSLGAAISLFIVFAFLLTLYFISGEFVVLPMVIVPLGGAFGAAIYYLLVQKLFIEGWPRTMAKILGISFYLLISYVFLVLAFAITGHWD